MASFVWLNGFMGSKIRDNVRIIRIDSLKRRNSNSIIEDFSTLQLRYLHYSLQFLKVMNGDGNQ